MTDPAATEPAAAATTVAAPATEPEDDPARPCTLLVTHPGEAALVVVARTGRPPVVPVATDRFASSAPAQIAATLEVTGLDTFLMRTPAEPDADGNRCVILAPRDGNVTLADGLTWSAGPTGHREADTVLAELAGAPVHPMRPTWSRRDFLAEVAAWTADRLAAAGTPLTGRLEQVQAWDLSCVWRAPTTAGRMYVKATAPLPLFAQEGTATTTLARLFPGQVPLPVAVDPARHWMIVPDLGPELGWDAPPEDLLDMIRAFARLQIASAGRVDDLLRGGCVERRLPWLVGYVVDWFTGGDLSTYVEADRAARLRALARDLPAHLTRLQRFGLPDTLLHGDLHPGNVARGAGGYAYFDWSDTSVGHPFVDMITIRRVNDPDRMRTRLDAYLGEWAAFGSPADLRAAWDAAELFTALHHAVSYASIVANLEPPVEPSLHHMVSVWLNQAVDAADRRPAADR